MDTIADLITSANQYFHVSNFKKAIELYNKAEKISSSSEIYYNRSIAYSKIKKFDDALKDIEKYVGVNSFDENGFYLKSLIFESLNNLDDAYTACQKAFELNPYNLTLVEKYIYFEKKRHPWKVLKSFPDADTKIVKKGKVFQTRSIMDSDLLHSQIVSGSPFTMDYFDMLLLPLFIKKEIDDILLIGVSAGTLARQYGHFTKGKIEGVDPYPEIFLKLKTILSKDTTNFSLHKDDGISFLKSNNKKYDLIIVDAFVAHKVPQDFISTESTQLILDKLTDDGILGFNTLIDSSHDYIKISNNLLKMFPSVFVVNHRPNKLFICLKKEMSENQLVNLIQYNHNYSLASLGEKILRHLTQMRLCHSLPSKKITDKQVGRIVC